MKMKRQCSGTLIIHLASFSFNFDHVNVIIFNDFDLFWMIINYDDLK
jgi:hypothetical protein